jgi:ribosomal protein S18 acetylase RimI-like enzyme
MFFSANIRKATMNDLDDIKKIADENKNIIGYVPRPALIESIEKQWVFVATHANKIIGFAKFRHRLDLQTTLYEICVDEPYRGKGVGRSLIHALEKEAKILGKEKIILKAPVDIPANKFYQHMDFICSETIPGKKQVIKNIWQKVIFNTHHKNK